MNTFVSMTIYFYITICIALLLFNIFYILFSKKHQQIQNKRIDKWQKRILSECDRLENSTSRSMTHSKMLESQLSNVSMLTAYHEAVISLREFRPKKIQIYLNMYQQSFLILAEKYRSRSPMERAFFAWLISVYRPVGNYDNSICETMLMYFDNSTVFCRENILQALYAMGQTDAVEQAFSIMNNNCWYHDRRLLADGLTLFTGDKEKLAGDLWKMELNEVFQEAVVQFASGISDSFAPEFLRSLTDSATPLEVRFALIRYFQKQYYPEAYPVLLKILSDGKDSGGLAIAAAAALVNYPCEETHQALISALHGQNYYVRHNCAVTLKKIGITEDELFYIWVSGDQYAVEMLEYILEKNIVSFGY